MVGPTLVICKESVRACETLPYSHLPGGAGGQESALRLGGLAQVGLRQRSGSEQSAALGNRSPWGLGREPGIINILTLMLRVSSTRRRHPFTANV